MDLVKISNDLQSNIEFKKDKLQKDCPNIFDGNADEIHMPSKKGKMFQISRKLSPLIVVIVPLFQNFISGKYNMA